MKQSIEKLKSHETRIAALTHDRIKREKAQRLLHEQRLKNQAEKAKEKSQRKLDRALSKIEREYKRDCILSARQQEVYEKEKEISTDKTMTKKQLEKKALSLSKAREKLLNKKFKDKTRTKEKTIKQKAFEMVQLFARIYRSDKDGYVILADTGNRVHYSECQGGHYYPKKNYPQLALNIYNILPITAWTNKAQGDNVGTRWEEGYKKMVGKAKYNEIVSIAEDKRLKNEVCDSAYYQKQYDYFKSKAILEFMRRGLPLHRLLK